MKPIHCPSFFKLLINDFSQKLTIPPAFAKKLKGKFPCATVLKTEWGGSWKVVVEEIDNKFCFADGWLEFANFHKLERYDILVFKLIKDSHFRVTVFDPSCCEKRPHTPNVVDICNPEIEAVDSDPSQKGCYSDCIEKPHCNDKNHGIGMKMETDYDEPEAYSTNGTEDPFFVTTLSWHSVKHLYQYLPVGFLKESGLSTRPGALLIRDPQGKMWPAVIKVCPDKRRHLTDGWSDLLKANKLKEGDRCTFKYIRNEGADIIQVEVLKREASAHPKRGRGRPRGDHSIQVEVLKKKASDHRSKRGRGRPPGSRHRVIP